jgi:hypothetical protein
MQLVERVARMFSIKEGDLASLERLIPDLVEQLGPRINDPALQVAAEEAKRILSDVRWTYGPPLEVIAKRSLHDPRPD